MNIWSTGDVITAAKLNRAVDVQGDTLTGNILIDKPRPEIQLLHSGTQKTRFLKTTEAEAFIALNAYHDGTSWYRDADAAAWLMGVSGDSYSIYRTAAGSGAISWSELLTITTSSINVRGLDLAAVKNLYFGSSAIDRCIYGGTSQTAMLLIRQDGYFDFLDRQVYSLKLAETLNANYQDITYLNAVRGKPDANSLFVTGYVTGGAPAQGDIKLQTGNAVNPQIEVTRIWVKSNASQGSAGIGLYEWLEFLTTTLGPATATWIGAGGAGGNSCLNVPNGCEHVFRVYNADKVKIGDNINILTGGLLLGGTEVITSARVLQNVTMDAGLVTSGRFGLSRLGWTAGKHLRGAGASADPIEVGGWEVVADTTLSVAATNVDFSGLDINSDGAYILYITLKNTSGGTRDYHMYINGDYTDTNYYRQRFTVESSSYGADRVNEPAVMETLEDGANAFIKLSIRRDADGYVRYQSEVCKRNASSVTIMFLYGLKTGTVANITDIRISSLVGDGIAAGSRFILCKVKSG